MGVSLSDECRVKLLLNRFKIDRVRYDEVKVSSTVVRVVYTGPSVCHVTV